MRILSNRLRLLTSLLLMAGPALSEVFAGMAQQDWYYRETLPAIRDWEDILTRWEKMTPEKERTPVFPVPENGVSVEWPNPIPSILWPEGEARPEVRASRTNDGKLRASWTSQGGASREETVDPEASVIGCRHPGGGGRDQWYHSYQRRFDRLMGFRPRLAAFALGVEPERDFRLGSNQLCVTITNVSDQALPIMVRLQWLGPRTEHLCAQQDVLLARGAWRALSLPFELVAPGGGLLLLNIEAGGRACWLPFLTHIEDVPAVLKSVDQILSDTPDARALASLVELRRAVADTLSPPSRNQDRGVAWRGLFARASALRDGLLLSRVSFDTLLFVKRKPYFSEQPFMDAHHLYNRPGGAICRLSPVRPDGRVTPVVDTLGEGIYRDVCLHWEGDRLLFAFGNGSDKWTQAQSYHIYETGLGGGKVRQVTWGPKNDCEPFYLPGGQVGFTSDRPEHFVMCGGDRHVANLFVMEADGSGARQLSFNVFNDFNPTVLPDGRILYSRWEYNERSVTSLHKLFTVNPDGTMMAPYYGNATIRPNVAMFPRAVPGSRKVMALFTAHHGQTHGPIGLVDVDRGMDGDRPVTVLTPGVPVTGEKAEDSRHGWFSDPWPLSETTYLCSFTPTVVPWLERSWALYVGDRHGNLALVYRDPQISVAEPVPVLPRPAPHCRPLLLPNPGATVADATLLLMDVYQGLPGVPRGEAKYLRILEDVPRKGVREGGVVVTTATGIYTAKRVLGTVPVEEDGSAYFLVPANRNVYVEVLDGREREIQRMRSVVCLKPGEQRTCAGCHEPRTTAPPNRSVAAAAHAPVRPAAYPWGEQTLSFLRDVQPILNRQCVRCHTFDRPANGVILAEDLTDQFNVAYEELVRYLATANAMRWDNPEDVQPRPPYTYGSKVSRLTRLLEAGHYACQLTAEEWRRLFAWIDANGVYYDRYESSRPDRHIFSGQARKILAEVHGRRCARCHGQSEDGRHDTWALSINRRDVRKSRALLAPLARTAGGWERCEEAVFADTNDPDYQKLSAALTALEGSLAKSPREDLISLRDAPAEREAVVLPEPPIRKEPPKPQTSGPWVFLSDLPWESARAGWTPNQDGLPRRDRDIEGRRLQLGARTYRKGLGTHAPSEIVYRLDGRYGRMAATVGGAEVNGTVVFQVYGDDKVLFDSGLMRGLRDVKSLDLSIAGVQRLRLVVTDGSDGYSADEANWAEARLLKTEQKATGAGPEQGGVSSE
jgi:hypothetical protein